MKTVKSQTSGNELNGWLAVKYGIKGVGFAGIKSICMLLHLLKLNLDDGKKP